LVRLKERIQAARAAIESDPYRRIEVGVSMRDGTRLAVDVYLPPAELLPAPTLTTPHTGYDKSQVANAITARYWNERGYVFVIADARGRGKSEGARDASNGWGLGQDGYDLVEWIADQPWSNGSVGGTGLSWTRPPR
jgi:putative CocE/NonD family hydrolase